MGSQNPLQPLAGVFSPATAAHLPSHNVTVKTVDELDSALKQNNGKPIMLDFYADWCTSCKIIEATTLKNKQIQNELDKFVVLKIDLTPNNKASKTLLNYFKVVAPPTFLFFDAKGNELNQLRLVGEVSVKQFRHHLNQVT